MMKLTLRERFNRFMHFEEVDRVRALGYLPTVDHKIPVDISLTNMTYYAKAKKRLSWN